MRKQIVGFLLTAIAAFSQTSTVDNTTYLRSDRKWVTQHSEIVPATESPDYIGPNHTLMDATRFEGIHTRQWVWRANENTLEVQPGVKVVHVGGAPVVEQWIYRSGFHPSIAVQTFQIPAGQEPVTGTWPETLGSECGKTYSGDGYSYSIACPDLDAVARLVGGFPGLGQPTQVLVDPSDQEAHGVAVVAVRGEERAILAGVLLMQPDGRAKAHVQFPGQGWRIVKIQVIDSR